MKTVAPIPVQPAQIPTYLCWLLDEAAFKDGKQLEGGWLEIRLTDKHCAVLASNRLKKYPFTRIFEDGKEDAVFIGDAGVWHMLDEAGKWSLFSPENFDQKWKRV